MPSKDKQETHTHKYQRVILGGRKIVKRDGKKYLEQCGGYEVFKCMIPKCPHYKAREMLVGAASVCWHCGEEMILNAESLRLKKSTHVWCRRVREQA